MKFKLIILLSFIFYPFINFIYGTDSLNGLILPSTEPGIYSNDVELSFNKVSGINYSYYFKGSLDHNPVPYIFPLSLSAVSGSTHSYHIVVMARDNEEVLQTKELDFTIDKEIPSKPELNYQDGIYNKSLKLEFSDQSDAVYYSFQSSQPDKFLLWHGEILELKQEKKLVTEFIKSYSEDKAGNRSSINVSSFSILPLLEKKKSLEILSPAPGDFLNGQLLYIDTSAYKWVRYTLNNTDPVLRGTSYIGPVMFKNIGTYQLRVAAMPLDSSNILTKEISFSIVDNKNIILNKASGVYKDDINLKFEKKGFLYNFIDRKVIADDSLLPAGISFMPVPGVIKYRTLRISDLSKEAEYRYFYVLDRRIPASPIISISDNLPITLSTEVRIISIPGTEIYYTTDGSTPDRYSSYYNRPFNMKIPAGVNSGSLMVKAIAYFNDKLSSPVISKLLVFDIKKPDKPEVTVISKELNQTLFHISNKGTNRIIYNLSYDGTEPEEPGIGSFTGKTDMIVSVPHGIQQKISIKAALIDRAGNISDSVMTELLEVDTVPPELPVINIKDDLLSMTGKNKIFYKISINSVSGEYQLYTTPVPLVQTGNNYSEIFVSGYSEDEKGNKSNIIISDKYIIDNRIAAVPYFTGIKDGGLYNTPLSLRFHSPDKINIYYTVGKDDVIPPDPVPGSSKKVSDFIYFECPVNETRNYNVKLAASYGDKDSALSDIQTLSFTIDRIAPRVPVINSVIDGKVYNHDIKITVEDTVDNVWILIKDKINEEDLNFSNFQMNGILLKKNYTLEQVTNTEKQYQLAALAIDKAGNTSISRGVVSFSIDKISPEAPKITVDTGIDGKSIVRMISPYTIVYEVKKDGSYPIRPNKNSVLYSLPLEFQNQKDSKIFITARSLDSAGNLSKESTYKKIIMDSVKPEVPLIDITRLSSGRNSISFATLTGDKIFIKEGEGDFIEYTSPMIIDLRGRAHTDLFYFSSDNYGNKSSVSVTRIEKNTSSGNIVTGISNNKIYNSGRVVWKSNQSEIVRYEVAIDNNTPKKVSIFSPELTQPIIFDSADGETLKVSISVKEFPENSFVTDSPETNINFTIDKTKPLVPTVVGVENNGYYQDGKTIELNSDAKVYYKLISSNDRLTIPVFKKYKHPLNIDTEEGEDAVFTIKLYSEDSAGNRSPVKIVNFTIDKANIYVSVNGNDSNQGSKLKPFKTIRKAFEFLNQSKRNIINLSNGEFLVDRSFAIADDVTILGGYNPDNWSSGMGETVIKISGRYSVGNSIFDIQSGKINIKNITISNLNLKAAVITMHGGSLSFNKAVFMLESSSLENSIKISNSNISLDDCDFNFSSLTKSNLINSKNSNITITKSRITGRDSSDDITIFNLDNTNISISNSVIKPNTAQKIRIFNTIASTVDIANTQIDTGFAKINSDIFVLKNTKLKIIDSIINSAISSRILSGFDVIDSNLSIQNTSFKLSANSGIAFLRAKNTSFEIISSEINANNTNEFIYLLDCKNSILNFEKNNITIGKSDIIKAFVLSSSVSVFRDNSITLKGGTTVFEGFDFISPLSIELVSNNIVSKNLSWISSVDKSAFNITGGKDSVLFKDNNIYGWKSILQYNGKNVKTTDELNRFKAFMQNPEGNYSQED